MRRTILIYGLAMAALVGLLKLVEYKYFVSELPLEYYIGMVALLFAALGIWVGLKMTRVKVIDTAAPFEIDNAMLVKLGISKREIRVGTTTTDLILGDVQPVGKKRMPAADWARGTSVPDDSSFA